MTTEQALYIAVNGRDLKINVCPWQTIRRQSYGGKPILHWQIDLLLTTEDMTSYNPADMSWDLQLMFYGYKRDAALMKLPKRFPLITHHSSSGIWPIRPIHGEANYVQPTEGTIYDRLDLQRGWIYDRVDKGWPFLSAVRQEEKDGTFELSGAMFAVRK